MCRPGPQFSGIRYRGPGCLEVGGSLCGGRTGYAWLDVAALCSNTRFRHLLEVSGVIAGLLDDRRWFTYISLLVFSI